MPAVEIGGFPTPNFNSGLYSKFNSPQCTWYCYGRMREIAGKRITFYQEYGLDGATWVDMVSNKRFVTINPQPNSIACWSGPSSAGHVAFVYGEQGGSVIFSDSNAGRNNTKTYAMPTSEFENQYGSGKFLGYIRATPHKAQREEMW